MFNIKLILFFICFKITSSEIELECGSLTAIPSFGNITSCNIFDLKITDPEITVKWSTSRGKSISHAKQLAIYESIVSNIPKGFFLHISHIKSFFCDDCGLIEIKASDFENANYLEIITLRMNPLSELSADLFKQHTKLKTLRIVASDIENIHRDAFRGLINLKGLDLFHNAIIELQLGIFDGLEKLSHLDMCNNRIEILPADLFKNNLNLIEVSFNNNLIKSIGVNLINNLSKLRKLSLHGNVCINEQLLGTEDSQIVSQFGNAIKDCLG
jgi:Leucine-rich repeat (LRR) protein